jgi:hypothetical protein
MSTSIQDRTLQLIREQIHLRTEKQCEVLDRFDYANSGVLLVVLTGTVDTLTWVQFDFQAKTAKFYVGYGPKNVVQGMEQDEFERWYCDYRGKFAETVEDVIDAVVDQALAFIAVREENAAEQAVR